MIIQQRNEPCQCGSGKKYKNCCMRKHEALSMLKKQTYDVSEVITPQTGLYMFWKRWSSACARSEYGLVYQMLLEGGSLKKDFATDEDFFVNLNEIGLAYEPVWKLVKMKTTPTTAMLLTQRVDDCDKNADVCIALMHLERTELGWRVTHIEQQKVKPSKDLVLTFDMFNVPSVEHAYLEKLKTGWTRTDYADKDPKAETNLDASTVDA